MINPDLIERLRRRTGGWTSNITYTEGAGPLINPDGPEAADRIEALSALHQELGEAFLEEQAELIRLSTECERLREAAFALVAKLDECTPHINRIFAQQWSRSGVQYSGPQFGEELEALRTALSQPTEKGDAK